MLRCAETFPGSFPTLQKLLKPLGGTLSQRLILLAMNKAKLPLMQRNCILVYYFHQDCQNRKTANRLRWLKDSSCCFTSFSPVYKKLKTFKDSDSKKPAKIRDLAWKSCRINNPSSMSCLCITKQDSSTLRSATLENSVPLTFKILWGTITCWLSKLSNININHKDPKIYMKQKEALKLQTSIIHGENL